MPRSVIVGLAALLAGLALAATPLTAQAQQETLEQTVQTQNKIVKKAAATQERINALSQQTQKLLREYLSTAHRVNQMQQYNEHLQGEVNDQEARIASLKEQLGEISDVEHGIIPLMYQMIAGLKNFIKLDMPFHREQRLARVNQLHDLMTNSDVTISEKYRQIMAAYKTEIDFGKTVEAYRALQTIEGQQQTVQFLRIGRISLCYQTLTGSRTACWNGAKNKWVVNDAYRRNVATGLAIARKQTTPNLILIPVLAPQPPLSVPEVRPEVQPPPGAPRAAPPGATPPAAQTTPAAQSQS